MHWQSLALSLINLVVTTAVTLSEIYILSSYILSCIFSLFHRDFQDQPIDPLVWKGYPYLHLRHFLEMSVTQN